MRVKTSVIKKSTKIFDHSRWLKEDVPLLQEVYKNIRSVSVRMGGDTESARKLDQALLDVNSALQNHGMYMRSRKRELQNNPEWEIR